MLFILYETFAWQTFVLLGLIVYIHTCCVPIATLNQNKQSRLLYLGNMHIIIKVLACGLAFSHLIGFFSCNTIKFQKYFLKVYGSVHVNSKRAHPPPKNIPPGICRAFVILSVQAGGNFSEHLCPGVGHLSNPQEAVNVIPFSIFHLKI